MKVLFSRLRSAFPSPSGAPVSPTTSRTVATPQTQTRPEPRVEAATGHLPSGPHKTPKAVDTAFTGRTPTKTVETLASLAVERMPALVQRVDGAIAKIQLNQLNSLPIPEQALDQWQIEIPVLTDSRFHTLSLEIEREKSDDAADTTNTWTVALSLDLGQLGWVHAKLQLRRGLLSTTLWAEQANTAKLAERHIDSLGKALGAAGLEMNGIRCHHGRPVEAPIAKAGGPLIQVSV